MGVLLLAGLGRLNAQDRLPTHVREWLEHRDVIVDYARVDSIAAARPTPLPRVMAPTREIIGYLPYWQYSHYPNLNYNLLTQINYFSAELDANGNISND
ncbi:MAG: hypothetical protein JSW54_13225, partial [Fidelibacterota bacterium]